MRAISAFSRPILPLTILLSFAMCGEESGAYQSPIFFQPDPLDPIRYSKHIQRDLGYLGCTNAGCHDTNSTNRLRIDRTYGQTMNNYQSLFTSNLVIKGDPTRSPLLIVPSEGVISEDPQRLHGRRLSGYELLVWQHWIKAQALY